MTFIIPNEADAAFPDQAEPDSVDFDILIAALAGEGIMSGCTVTAQGTPNMTVDVASGQWWMGGTRYSFTGETETIAAADGSNPRFDLISVNTSSNSIVTAGTPATNPVFPAIPSNATVVAAIYVPASDTDIDANQIVDKRVLVSLKNSGTATINNTTTGIAVSHDLGVAPTVAEITITAAEDPSNSVGLIWVDTIDTTKFAVNVEADPGASNLTFGWRVEIL